MYCQTHLYFAERVLGQQNDRITLGCILPDMVIGGNFNHFEAHCLGLEIYGLRPANVAHLDLIRAVATHGFKPKGLDYYGDEQYLDFERGYCFEKARALTERTVDACNIPPEMGWWKAHNIVEMGVETIISARDNYYDRLRAALSNRQLVQEVDALLGQISGAGSVDLVLRAERFYGFIEKERATAESLANKYSRQMQMRHNVNIDATKVALLINDAAELVAADIMEFFEATAKLVTENIGGMKDLKPGDTNLADHR